MLIVRYAGRAVGTLHTDERELVLGYASEWLASHDAFALSPRLPLQAEPWRGEEVLTFFANLLPEGPVLDALCRLRRLPRGNVYRLLEAFGRECAGAFELVPQDDTGARAPGYRAYPPDVLAADLQALRNNVPLLQSHDELRLSLAGAQNKIPVAWRDGTLWLPTGGAASTHILKPALQPDSVYPDSVYNKALCMRLAAALGLPVAGVQVITDPEPLLLIERFDRVIEGVRVQRIHQLDFCQLSGLLPDQKYEADGGPGFSELFALVDTHSALPARDRLQLVDWLIFNVLIGNADAHGKNISMLYGPDGRLRLAPAYDLVATAYWPQLSDKLAMAIGGERRPDGLMARHWRSLSDAAGLNFAQLRRRAIELSAAAVAKLPEAITGLQLDSEARLTRHLTSVLAGRMRQFEARLAADSSA